MEQLHAFSAEFNTYLEDYIEKKTHSCASLTKDSVFLLALEQVRRLILGAGKRIRPYNAYMGFCVGNGRTDNIRQIDSIKNHLLAIELFHVFCLIHDDIIDKSLLRRGLPTIHAVIYEKYAKEKRMGDIYHAANSHAILMGDVVFSWIMELLQPNQISEAQKKAVEENKFKFPQYATNHTEKLCKDKWTKRGVLNDRMFEYCSKQASNGYREALDIYKEYENSVWIQDVVNFSLSEWTKRGITDYNMFGYEVKKHKEGYFNLAYEISQKTVTEAEVRKCSDKWYPSFNMLVYCLKK